MFLEKDKPDEASMFRFPPHTPQTFKIARLKIVKSNDQARELSEPHLLQVVFGSLVVITLHMTFPTHLHKSLHQGIATQIFHKYLITNLFTDHDSQICKASYFGAKYKARSLYFKFHDIPTACDVCRKSFCFIA